MKKRKRLTICLVAGVLILAVSATAAFGSVNGYSRYKEAVKALALETDNFSAQCTMVMTCDGETVMNLETQYAMDGVNNATHSKEWRMGNDVSEYYSTRLDGVDTWFNTKDIVYYQSGNLNDSDTAAENLLGIDTDDEMMDRLVNFTEIAADTVMGELKNNFVQVGTENGSTLYQVEIAKNQVPSLVNAGLSLFAYGVGESNYMNGVVQFEDYSALILHRYEQSTGEALPQEFKDGYLKGSSEQWYKTYADLIDKVNASNAENWEGTYYDMLNEKGGKGIVFVSADGSAAYYSTYQEFAAAHPDNVSDDIGVYVGQDMKLETVLCKFGVDNEGRLTSNDLQVTFQTTDQAGDSHTLAITVDVTLSGYGTTTIQPLDVGDREKAA